MTEQAFQARLAKDRSAFVATVDVSRETLARFDRYAALLLQWQRAINLVGPATLDAVWTRHFLDSMQLRALVGTATTFVDLGSGAGFPGLVLAVMLKEEGRGHVNLVESHAKKTAFLHAVVRDLALPATVHTGRIEAVVPRLAPPEVVTARALAPLEQLLRWSEPLLINGAIGLFPKGRELYKEIDDAARFWQIDVQVHPSRVAADSGVIEIRSVSRRHTGTAGPSR